jgi:hypothetical protein
MNKADLESILYRVISKKSFFTFKNKRYCLTAASFDIKQRALEIYYDTISDEKYNGWLRESNLINLLIHYGYWTPFTENLIKDLNKQVDKTKISLYENRLNSKMVTSIRKQLKQLYNQLDKILSQKQELYQHTLEGYANSIRNEYILCNCLLDEKNNKVLSFNSNSSYILFNGLVAASNEKMITVSQLRELARDNLWKSIWNCNKSNPFGEKGAIYLSDDQRGLINFSIMYDSVYDHTECPEDFVIDDDDMLDGWILYQKEKVKRDKTRDALSKTHKNAQEVFIMAQNQEDLERISDLNDDISKGIIKSRINATKQNGIIDELDLPDVRSDIDQQLASKAGNYNRK